MHDARCSLRDAESMAPPAAAAAAADVAPAAGGDATSAAAAAAALRPWRAAALARRAHGAVAGEWASAALGAFGCTVLPPPLAPGGETAAAAAAAAAAGGTGADAGAEVDVDLVLSQPYHPGWRCWRWPPPPGSDEGGGAGGGGAGGAAPLPLAVHAVLPGLVSVRLRRGGAGGGGGAAVHVACAYVPLWRPWKVRLAWLAAVAVVLGAVALVVGAAAARSGARQR